MKNLPNIRIFRRPAFLAALCLCAFIQPGWAEKGDKKHDHDHHHARMAGPNGGRVLHEVHPHAELLVTKDRKLQLTFLTEKGKATAPKEQTMTVICGKRTSPAHPASNSGCRTSSRCRTQGEPTGSKLRQC